MRFNVPLHQFSEDYMNKHTIDIITSSDEEEPSFAMIADYEGSEENMFNVIDPNGETLPVLPVRNMVLFPGVVMPVTIGRSKIINGDRQ